MVPIKVSEKRRPHYDLKELKELIRQGRWFPTEAAKEGAVAVGLSWYEIKEIVLDLRPGDFYKSMTSYGNHKLWQDVYKPRIFIQEEYIELYIKLQKSFDEKCIVISFKRSEDYDNV
jgi:motility quorum-sensing regulator/GCU-specific mRNA interferase toxin